MGEPLRILRVVIVSALILLGVKAINLVTGYHAVASQAQEQPSAPVSATEVKHAAAAPNEAPAGKKMPPEKDPDAERTATPTGEMSRAEVELLQNLSSRRQELEERARELDMREKLLRASEDRVGERISELKSIEANIQNLLQQRDQAQEAELVSLVKVYEGMKPKDAARIFDKLEMEILLPVARRMKSAKAAAVMAEMDPDAAKQLTVSLARHFSPDNARAPAPVGEAAPAPAAIVPAAPTPTAGG